MIYKELPLLENSEKGTKLTIYIQTQYAELAIKKRPFILICPGGGYEYTSVREAEPLALQFLAMGCHAAVLDYSTAPAGYPQALTELAHSIKYIRDHAEEWQIDEKRIFVQGSSAGGHLAASIGMFWTEEWLYKAAGASSKEEIRPNGMILSYPVITSGEYAHRGSFDLLLGMQTDAEDIPSDKKALIEKMSLEKQVNEHTPPAFIWHTMPDDCVPVENSLMLVAAMKKYHIPTEFHMFPEGGHGLALANELTRHENGNELQTECEKWIQLVERWIFQGKPWRKLS